MRRLVFSIALVLAAFAAAACGGADNAPALTADALRNATYEVDFAPSGEVTLVDGEFRQPVAPGSATEIVVRTAAMAFGDLNDDGDDDAAVVLIVDPGGSGTFYFLAAVLNDDGAPRYAASALLGDRIIVQSVSIEDGEVEAGLLVRPPDAPFSATPTVEKSILYRLVGKALLEQ